MQSDNAADTWADLAEQRRPPPQLCQHVRRQRVCPGRQAPFWAVKRPVRPDKSAIQNRCTMGNAKGA